jgi:transcriptional regulator with GAF, ATPase, and Fis domain
MLDRGDVEPIPETVEALRDLTRHGDTTIARTLWQLSHEVQRLVPEIVGLSLSLVEENLTFTMSATAALVAELDGMQYLAGGPCEETLRTREPHIYRAEERDAEQRWQIFARATAAQGVASTLSLPLSAHGRVGAGINLYGATVDAFDGRHDALAAVCGATADGITTNADLEFTTRSEAAETPGRIRAARLVDQAIGILMGQLDVDLDEAENRLRCAAQRADISDAQMAGAILQLVHEDRIE